MNPYNLPDCICRRLPACVLVPLAWECLRWQLGLRWW